MIDPKPPRDPLLGQFAIIPGDPPQGGRILTRTLDGHYVVTIMTDPRHGLLVTEAQMIAERWSLYIFEADWRRAWSLNPSTVGTSDRSSPNGSTS